MEGKWIEVEGLIKVDIKNIPTDFFDNEDYELYVYSESYKKYKKMTFFKAVNRWKVIKAMSNSSHRYHFYK